MNTEEILSRLCTYDPRNPDHIELGDDSPPPREACYCDNCFYGRDRMALHILDLQEQIDKLIKSKTN
jgi:hypothetical protein